MPSPRPPDAPPSDPAGPQPGDPLDPARARAGRRCMMAITCGLLAVYFAFAMSLFGSDGPGTGLLGRWLGWDLPLAAALPAVLLPVVPNWVLSALPRRPERSFLCGMQDAADPKRNPNWRLRTPTAAVRRRRLRIASRLVLGIVAAIAVAVAVVVRGAAQPSPGAGRPLPELPVAALLRPGTALPRHLRLTGAEPAYPQLYERRWRLKQTRYLDIYVPVRAAGQAPDAPVGLLLKATYTDGSGQDPDSDPPVPPLEGEPVRTRLPAWLVARFADRGADVRPDVVELRRERLHGRIPDDHADTREIAVVMGCVAGGTLLVTAIITGLMGREPRRPAPREPWHGSAAEARGRRRR